MTLMTHSEALQEAMDVFFIGLKSGNGEERMEAAIRAYLDARGMEIVPREEEGDAGMISEAVSKVQYTPASTPLYEMIANRMLTVSGVTSLAELDAQAVEDEKFSAGEQWEDAPLTPFEEMN